jgi:hypothetical protein
MRTDDPMLALQRDTQNRQVILWSVVVGILASVMAFPFLAGTFHPAGLRDTGLMGVRAAPRARLRSGRARASATEALRGESASIVLGGAGWWRARGWSEIGERSACFGYVTEGCDQFFSGAASISCASA